MLNTNALGALGALGYMFFEPSAVGAVANLSPSEKCARAIGGYGGVGARAHLAQPLKKPCKKNVFFTQKTNCLFFKLAQN